MGALRDAIGRLFMKRLLFTLAALIVMVPSLSQVHAKTLQDARRDSFALSHEAD